MSKENDPKPLADGSVPRLSSGIKYRVSKSTLDTNWLLNAVMNTKNLQITQISDEDLIKFLDILDKGDLRMPDDELGLEWVKNRLKKRLSDANNQRGESWYKIAERYGFIIEQIDLRLALRGT